MPTVFVFALRIILNMYLTQAPLDHAKRNMMGSARVVIAANLLFVPFAAMMLVTMIHAADDDL